MVREHKTVRPRWWKGARVRVRNRFDRSWASGFEVEDHDAADDDGRSRYVVRRMSDGATLPTSFTEEELGPA